MSYYIQPIHPKINIYLDRLNLPNFITKHFLINVLFYYVSDTIPDTIDGKLGVFQLEFMNSLSDDIQNEDFDELTERLDNLMFDRSETIINLLDASEKYLIHPDLEEYEFIYLTYDNSMVFKKINRDFVYGTDFYV